MPKGLLLVLTEPPASLEEEFNAWYDTEHIAERTAVKGFLSGLRFVCVEGGPKYLALYDLQSIDVLQSAEYLAGAGDNFSPWTKRITARSRIYRAACRQVDPGEAVTGRCARLLVLRFTGLAASAAEDVAAGLNANFAGHPDVVQSRSFVNELDGSAHHIGLVEMRSHRPPLDLGAFGSSAHHLDLIATYRPY